MVADAISCLDYCPVQNNRETRTFTQCWCYYALCHTRTQQPAIHPASMNLVFANCSEEDVIYPPAIKKIAEAQETYPNIHKLTSDSKYNRQLVENTQVLCKCTAMVLPTALQHKAISWYHHYLQHPGTTSLEETLRAVMYWKGMQNTIQKYVKNCRKCQVNKWHKHKYGKVPTKLVIQNPWEALYVDLIEPYTLKEKTGIDPAMS